MISKLVIYDYKIGEKYGHYAEYSDKDGKATGKAYALISDSQAATLPILAVYEGKRAAMALWDMEYAELTDKERKTIMSVFPTLPEMDKSKLKPPQKILDIAHAKILKHFGVTCQRCGGSGNYAWSVAFTVVDNGVCHKCGGSGKQLPILTHKKLGEIKAFFEVSN